MLVCHLVKRHRGKGLEYALAHPHSNVRVLCHLGLWWKWALARSLDG